MYSWYLHQRWYLLQGWLYLLLLFELILLHLLLLLLLLILLTQLTQFRYVGGLQLRLELFDQGGSLSTQMHIIGEFLRVELNGHVEGVEGGTAQLKQLKVVIQGELVVLEHELLA